MERMVRIEKKVQAAERELMMAVDAMLPVGKKVVAIMGKAMGMKARRMQGFVVHASDRDGRVGVKSIGGKVHKKHYTDVWYDDIKLE